MIDFVFQLSHRGRRRVQAASQRGLTLIELMVGVALGLLTTVVIAQVLMVSEERRRTTSAGSDAQTKGALALYALQREVVSAGYGINAQIGALGCEIRAKIGNTTSTYTLAPIVITDGASGASDQIRILRSAKTTFSLPTRVVEDHPRTAANFFVNTTMGIEDGDIMIAVPPASDSSNWCSLFNVTHENTSGGNGGGNGNGNSTASNGGGNSHINHSPGANGPWNQAGGQTIFPTAGYPAGSFLVNLGQLVLKDFRIDASSNLELESYNSAANASTTDDLYPDIVNLQAYYGRDTDGDKVVDTYDNTTPTTAADWAKVKAVRVAIVVRSTERSRDPVTQAEPVWDVGTVAVPSGAVDCNNDTSKCITLKVHGPNPSYPTSQTAWKYYRYKVYDTVMPMRNLLWNS